MVTLFRKKKKQEEKKPEVFNTVKATDMVSTLFYLSQGIKKEENRPYSAVYEPDTRTLKRHDDPSLNREGSIQTKYHSINRSTVNVNELELIAKSLYKKTEGFEEFQEGLKELGVYILTLKHHNGAVGMVAHPIKHEGISIDVEIAKSGEDGVYSYNPTFHNVRIKQSQYPRTEEETKILRAVGDKLDSRLVKAGSDYPVEMRINSTEDMHMMQGPVQLKDLKKSCENLERLEWVYVQYLHQESQEIAAKIDKIMKNK